MKNYLLFIVIFLSLVILKYSKAEDVDKKSVLKAVISGISTNYAPIKKAHIVIEKISNTKGIRISAQDISQEKMEIFILDDNYRVDTTAFGQTYSTRFYEGKWWRKSGERITISPRGERGLVRYDPRENFMIDTDEKLVEYLNRVAMKNCKIIKNDQGELIEMSFFEISEYLGSDGKKGTTHKEKIFLFDPSKNFLPVHETQIYNDEKAFEVEYKYRYRDNLRLWFLLESRQTAVEFGVVVHKVTQTDFHPNIDISLFEFPKQIPDETFVDDHINDFYMAGLENTKRKNFRKTIFVVSVLILITIGIIGGYYGFKKRQSKHKK
ncbi:MAG: hypothetical protein LBK82_16650 [Planctomycetaceae bacterium]|jgi:hypothetical protein|nr:hypothetical protein [Planctomycetaceae bacterium]